MLCCCVHLIVLIRLGGADSLPDIVPPLKRTIDLDGQNSQAASSSKAMTSQCTTY